jgi:hypothetical protein
MKSCTLLFTFLAPATTLALTTRHLSEREVSTASSLPSSWTYSGCYVDSVSSRALSSASYNSASGMTGEACVSFCISRGFPVAGTEYSAECYCGIGLPAQPASDPATCNMPCSGDATEACGGSNLLTVYTDSSYPVVNPGPAGWKSLECYTDGVSARTLPINAGHLGGDSGLTVALCAQACSGYAYFGVEYAGECYCGNSILNGGASALPSGCDMPCKGNPGEFCGGSNRLNLYQSLTTTPTPPPSSGCNKAYQVCCMGVAPWYTNQGVWGGVCGYYPSNPNEIVGARCIQSELKTVRLCVRTNIIFRTFRRVSVWLAIRLLRGSICKLGS